MISVLLYSRKNEAMTQIISDQLETLGYNTEQTQIVTIPRLILNNYQVIHFVIESLPLTTNEFLCLTSAKALGKAVVISILNAKPSDKNFLIASKSSLLNWMLPDALTVSQTNHLKIFRDFTAQKMIVPTLFEMKTAPKKTISNEPITGFVFPLFEKLEEATEIHSEKPVYFDGRQLLAKNDSSDLRKKWMSLLTTKKIKSNYHLILSDKKIKSLLEGEPLGLIVSSTEMQPTEFSKWVSASLDYEHLLILSQYQATGFSSHWTSGHNCFVTSSHHWLRDLNANMGHLVFNQPFAISDITKTSVDSLFNELSRLYTKIINQNTTLLDSDSAKI